MSDARRITLNLGGEWRASGGAAPCPVCQPERRSDQRALSITQGVGIVLLHCFKLGCAFRDIAAAAGGVASCSMARPDPAVLASQEVQRKAGLEKRERQARAVWTETLPISGTLAETYLRRRGITAALAPSLRFQPECWHGATATRHPALVALVEGAAGYGVHRTYLRADGAGKAAVKPPKAMLGQCGGGAVRLTADKGPLVVCEGIETGLSLLSGLLAGPATVWAALSTSGMRALRLPSDPGELIVAADSDDRGAGHEAAQSLAERAYGLGWKVSLWPAPAGMDWNDFLCGMPAP